ncbi:ferredoxin [Mariprofundus erugo]|uniref:Ferredoxin n=1 Tax=Mariprofundus erugo TaxID=2528639 RepID=A0A5R9GUZ6_9PROT|nr:ferredoxin [Mariprofundus erugo]TLS68755.1 ferredoxin [Mariprofundus erugo]TLS77555.1 ferredoxin [Mariprofundus erugo]
MKKPVMPPYRRHAILCCGKSCGENLPLLNYLKKKVADAGLVMGDPDSVRVNRAGCLGICSDGPIMVVHPEGVWYCNLDEAGIDRIVEEHFRQGKVVESLAFYQANPPAE